MWAPKTGYVRGRKKGACQASEGRGHEDSPFPGCWKRSTTKLEKLVPLNKSFLLMNIKSAGWSGPGIGTKYQRVSARRPEAWVRQGTGQALPCFAPEPPQALGGGGEPNPVFTWGMVTQSGGAPGAWQPNMVVHLGPAKGVGWAPGHNKLAEREVKITALGSVGWDGFLRKVKKKKKNIAGASVGWGWDVRRTLTCFASEPPICIILDLFIAFPMSAAAA